MLKRWLAAAVVAGLAGATAGYMHRTSEDAQARVTPVQQEATADSAWAAHDASHDPDGGGGGGPVTPALDPAEVAGQAGLGGQESFY